MKYYMKLIQASSDGIDKDVEIFLDRFWNDSKLFYAAKYHFICDQML